MTNKRYIPILAVLGAIMLVVVAAMAPPQSFLGRDFVYAQVPTDDASLTALTLISAVTAADIMPDTVDAGGFVSTTKTYSVRAPSGTNKVTVNAMEAAVDKATVTITPPDRDSATGHQVILTGGRNTVITVRVRSEDRTVTETYTLTVYQERTQASDNENLSALSLSDVTLSPAFGSAKTRYRGRAAYSTQETTVSYRADIGATVEIQDAEGAAIPDVGGDPSNGHQVALNDGQNVVINVVVKAEDQFGETSTSENTKTYMVTVYRERLVKSDNASLSATNGLTLRDGPISVEGSAAITFEYSETTMSYPPNMRLATGIRAVTVAYITDDDGAVAVITPSDQDSETLDHQVLLRAGAKTNITVKVTAEDGTTTETYSVTIYRERRLKSDNEDLSALSLSGITLSPAFASNKMSYMGRAAYSTEKTTVSYGADIGADVEIQNAEGVVIPDVGGDPSNGHQVALNAGENNVINVVVKAEVQFEETSTSDNTKTYMVEVYRENLVKSDDATLLALSLGEDADGAIIPTSGTGVFDSDTTMYSVRATNGVSAVTVVASATDDGAVVVITPSDQDSLIDDHQVVLRSGAKTDITVKVTAEDGTTTETYIVTVYRERRLKSDNEDLSALSLSGITLSPAFASNTLPYMGKGGIQH